MIGPIEPFNTNALRLILDAKPIVEYNLKLDGVETPDSEFSLTSTQMRELVANTRR